MSFIARQLKRLGVYVYTVTFDAGGYLASYVGETGTIFLKRIKEHTINALGGYDRIYEPKEYGLGGGGAKVETDSDFFSSQIVIDDAHIYLSDLNTLKEDAQKGRSVRRSEREPEAYYFNTLRF
jgi:hypothetical protein